MQITLAILHGLFLALGLILPLGIQNIFIFNQAATQPTFVRILPSIITASICDTIIICLSVLGTSLIIFEFAWLKLLILSGGSVILFYLSWLAWKKGNKKEGGREERGERQALSAKKQIIVAAAVSLLNPHAIIDAFTVIGGSAIQYSGAAKIAYTITCVTVSWVWFFSLAWAGRSIGKSDKDGYWLRLVNKISAVIMLAIALYLGKQALSLVLEGRAIAFS